MNYIKSHRALSAIVLIIAIVIIAAIAGHGGGGGGGGYSKPASKPHYTAPAKPAPAKPKPPVVNERADLTYFRLSDRSVPDLTDIWVTWAVTNHSSKASDYQIDWEALNSSGTRVDSGEQLTTNVQPGQTAKDSSPTSLDTSHVKLVITKFDRTESFG